MAPRASGGLLKQLVDTLVAVFIMLVTPPTVVVLGYTATTLKGDFAAALMLLAKDPWTTFTQKMVAVPDEMTWTLLISFATFEAFLMVFVPGKPFDGPTTPMGNVPKYRANGVQCYAITLATLAVLYHFGVFTATLVYDQLIKIYVALTVGSFIICLLLYVKGHVAPPSTDSGSVGNPIMDFYWGMELYPRIFGFDLKMFFNCRFGMMSWPVLIVIYALKQYEDTGAVSDMLLISVVVQLIYLTKFYVWETGYLWTLDIMHDRFGYYICWGICSWVPSLYTASALFWVQHPTPFLREYGVWPTVGAILLGAYLVFTNWAIDQQRIDFRKNSNAPIWGAKPTYIEAEYNENGTPGKNKLLTSGWWGISRHINYTFELLATLSWAPMLQFNYILPYCYFLFLTALLLHRTFRDELRMSTKYGKYYDEYCKVVPYKMIPYVF